MSIHQRIKERRLALGMTSHKALAERLGVSWQTVQLWEKDGEGGTAPKRARLDDVARELGVSSTWLLYGGQSPDALASDPVPAPKEQPLHQEYIWASADEIHLLTLYRTTDDRSRDDLMKSAEELPRVILPRLTRNES